MEQQTTERTEIRLFAANERVRAWVERALPSATSTDHDLVLGTLPVGDLVEVVSTLSEQLEGAPFGIAVEDEASALEVISAGADAARVVAGTTALEVVPLLVEHTLLRAQMRHQRTLAARALAQGEKLAALGTLVAGVGHEINNPLSAIMLSLGAVRNGLRPVGGVYDALRRATTTGGLSADEAEALAARLDFRRVGADGQVVDHSPSRMLDEMEQAARSVAAVVGDLRVFVRSTEDEQPSVVHADDLVDHAVRLVAREVPGGIIERDYAADLPALYLPRNRVTQVLTNLLVNAAHAMQMVERDDHRIRVSIRAEEDHLAMSVSDTGPGIPSAQLERIFDPFFTTKREGLGTGLGLSISRSILQRLGGDLLATSVYGDGATFICMLPLGVAPSERPTERPPVRRSAVIQRGGPRTILVVDDDERLLRAYARILAPHRIITARDGREAIELLRSGSAPHAIVAELALPEVDGPDLERWLLAELPELTKRIVWVTGAAARPRYASFIAAHPGVLMKPVDAEELVRAVNASAKSGPAVRVS